MNPVIHLTSLKEPHFFSREEDKLAALMHLVRHVVGEKQPTLLFAATRHHVEFLHTLLEAEGIEAACVYGSMDQVRPEPQGVV